MLFRSNKFRKPQPGMLKLASHIEFPDKSWYVGDRLEDEQAAAAAGINFMWADVWRDRFTPGMYDLRGVTTQQLEFLEDVNFSGM